MIGRIETQMWGLPLQATLEDDQSWTCSDETMAVVLNALAPPYPGYMPPQRQLEDGAAKVEGRILEMRKPEKTDPAVAY